MKLRTTAIAVAMVLALCAAAGAAPLSGVTNQVVNGNFSAGLNSWEYVPGQVIANTFIGNGAPAAQCDLTTATWGDMLRQVIDTTWTNDGSWNANKHQKLVDLTADIAVIVKNDATGGVRFRLDYWTDYYLDAKPTVNTPGYTVTAWQEYKSSQNMAFTTVNPFHFTLETQPRWMSVEIEFWQPDNAINLVDNVTLTSMCVPEPGSVIALLTGIVGLAGLRLRRRA